MAGSYYSDDADLLLRRSRLIELTDNPNAQDQIDQDAIDLASRKAERWINAKLKGAYVVPFEQGNVPPEIAELHEKFKRYYLYAYSDAMTIPKEITDEMKAADAALDDYADAEGGLILDAPRRTALDGTAAGGGGAISSDPAAPALADRVFGLGRDRLT